MATRLKKLSSDIALFMASQCIPAMSQRGLNALDNEVYSSVGGFSVVPSSIY
jgi:hypothetical protein